MVPPPDPALSVDPAVAADVSSSAGAATSKRSAIRSSVITLGGYGASSAIRFVSNLMLTRLLFPEQFGVMALVNVVIVSLYLFSDIGIGPNIIQSRDGDDPTFLDTAWTIQVFRGAALWIISCLAAWPLSRFYAQPQIFYLLPVAGLMALAGGLESTRAFTHNRHLNLGRVAAIETVSQAVGVVLMLAIAVKTRSIWSLVLGSVLSSFLKTVLTHTVLPGHRNRLSWDPAARKAILTFGRWIFMSTALTCLSGQSDRLILGKLVSASMLGLYAIAGNLASLPGQLIGQLSQRVLYPVIATALRQGDHQGATIRKNNTRLLLVLAPIVGMGIVLSAPVVSLLYRRDYWEVGPLVAILTIGTWLGAISTSYTITLLAAGLPKYLAFGNIAKTVLFVSLIFFASERYGLAGVALLVSLSELGNLVVAMIGCRLTGTVAWKTDIAMTIFIAAYAAFCKVLYEASLRFMHGVRIGAIAVVAGITALVVVGLAKRSKLI